MPQPKFWDKISFQNFRYFFWKMFKIYRLWTLLPEADPLPPGSDSPSPGVGTWWFVLHTTCSRSKSTPAGTVGRSEHRCCPSHSQFLGYEMFKHPRLQGTEYILRLDQASVEEEALTPPGVCSHRAEGAPPPTPAPRVLVQGSLGWTTTSRWTTQRRSTSSGTCGGRM